MSAADAPLGIVALVAHARHVRSAEREQFAAEAAAIAADPRVIVLHTCHRVELYAAPDGGDPDDAPVALPALPEGGRRLDGHAAARHLFTVAAGLDSVVVGEDQILHQLRDSLADRQLGGGSHPVPILDRLFQIALHVGRQARAWREGPPRSLADVALDRIEQQAGSLVARPLLVVGAGRMSRLAALAAARRRARVIVSNRSPERARALAADVDGDAVGYGRLPEAFAGVVLAVAGPWNLAPDAVRTLAEHQAPVVDLSSPPAVDAALRDALGARFVSVDDLARGPEDTLRDRVRRRVARLVNDADGELGAWVAARDAVPAIQALTELAESRRAAEVDRLLRRLPHLEDRDRELVEQMSRRLVAGLLHAPLSTLREDSAGDHERAARDLFLL